MAKFILYFYKIIILDVCFIVEVLSMQLPAEIESLRFANDTERIPEPIYAY